MCVIGNSKSQTEQAVGDIVKLSLELGGLKLECLRLREERLLGLWVLRAPYFVTDCALNMPLVVESANQGFLLLIEDVYGLDGSNGEVRSPVERIVGFEDNIFGDGAVVQSWFRNSSASLRRREFVTCLGGEEPYYRISRVRSNLYSVLHERDIPG